MSCSHKPEASLFAPDQPILVTGASSGIGRAIALRCNALGATVIANGRDGERLRAARGQAERPEAFLIEAKDLVSDMEVLPGWVAKLREKYGKLGGFVHSAGLGLTAPLRLYDLEVSRKLFDIHVHAPMLLTRGFADRRNNIGPGSAIVFLTSTAAVNSPRATLAYASAKSALLAAARCASRELAAQGTRVNSIAPALVETPMGQGTAEVMGEENFTEEKARYPFGLGKPEDVASMACFLLSQEARWITGQNIVMDGGRY